VFDGNYLIFILLISTPLFQRATSMQNEHYRKHKKILNYLSGYFLTLSDMRLSNSNHICRLSTDFGRNFIKLHENLSNESRTGACRQTDGQTYRRMNRYDGANKHSSDLHECTYKLTVAKLLLCTLRTELEAQIRVEVCDCCSGSYV
jgi:hypothetical protein